MSGEWESELRSGLYTTFEGPEVPFNENTRCEVQGCEVRSARCEVQVQDAMCGVTKLGTRLRAKTSRDQLTYLACTHLARTSRASRGTSLAYASMRSLVAVRSRCSR